MLTLLKNIERFNKRYNKKRGSAMLMVLMTMAIIIVVGTSMLFVTLSSFSNSIADTQQERAYNAALTGSDTLKGSTQLNTIIETYFTKIKENGSAEVQFYNDTDFDNQAVNYTIVNGVKVYVTLSKSPSSSANKIDKVLVDIKGVKGSQESTVSFEADSVPDGWQRPCHWAAIYGAFSESICPIPQPKLNTFDFTSEKFGGSCADRAGRNSLLDADSPAVSCHPLRKHLQWNPAHR